VMYQAGLETLRVSGFNDATRSGDVGRRRLDDHRPSIERVRRRGGRGRARRR
jgi:hypothetical protein